MDYYLTVGQLTTKVKELFEFDPLLQDVWVLGEVSNLSRPPSGHLYFSLKDDEATLNCVMWKTISQRLGHLVRSGDAVFAHGHVSIYEPRGIYQLYVDDILAMGAGRLYQEFEALKERLQAEGLFDEGRKRPLPAFPRRIGVVTSAAGAAWQDILNVLARRYPLVEVVLSPSLVQGPEAPSQIVRAIDTLHRYPDGIEVIIVARGGGAMEELWAFNDERVARAIYASKIPVISGVGHQTDFTIADFVADVRAPTPSAAAEMAVPDREELREMVAALRAKLTAAVRQHTGFLERELRHQLQVLQHFSPQSRIDTQRQHIDHLLHRIGTLAHHRLSAERSRLDGLIARLEALNPRKVLHRGYAIVLDRSTRHVIGSVGQVHGGQAVDVRLSDGEFGAIVE